MSGRSVVWLIIVAAVAFMLSLRYSGGLLPSEPARTVEVVNLVPQPDCEPVGRPCRALGEGVSLTVELPADVRPMRTFLVEVKVSQDAGGEPEAVVVAFEMAGMDMGVNRFALEHRDAEVWAGQVTLPICTTDRTDWLVTVDADVGERRYRARFPFEAQ